MVVCWQDITLPLHDRGGRPPYEPCCSLLIEAGGNQRPERGTDTAMGGWSCFPPKASSLRQHGALAPAVGLSQGKHSRDAYVPCVLGTQAGRNGMQERTEQTARNTDNTQLVPTASILRKREREITSTIQTDFSVTRKPTQRKLGQCVACW